MSSLPRTRARDLPRSVVLCLTLGFTLAGGATLLAPAATAQIPAKIAQGKVFNAQETPLSGAIVYLQNEKTNEVKTFITTPDGSYRFGQLSADTDFILWARYKDQKSKTRLISSFDTKLTVTQDFHIP